MKKGIIYGVGVGPGDPELMTLKSVRLILENDVIAVPGKNARGSAAYQIAVKIIPELADKELVAVCMPMTKDRKLLDEAHKKAAEQLEAYLDKGKNVVFLTLGDPSIYSTFSYLKRILENDGYTAEPVSGVPSFCAAAARLGIPLAESDEQLHIIPALHISEDSLSYPGNYVLMKSASHIKEVKELLEKSDLSVYMAENCGMGPEKIYRSADEIPDTAGYFSLIIAKNNTEKENLR